MNVDVVAKGRQKYGISGDIIARKQINQGG
jgi:hypothetical protein